MNNCTVNFSTSETSTNCTTESIGPVESLRIFVFTINFLVGFPTHSYVLWLIVTGSGLGSEFFILNLSVCEIGTSLNCLFYVLSKCFSSIAKLPWFLMGLVYTGRPLFQCLICVERYLAVVHPVTFLKYKPLRYRVICCSAAWIITLASCFCCIFTVLLDTQFFSLQFFLFFLIQLFCLVAVLRALKQSGPGERKREEENHMKRRAFNVILITTVSMTVIYFPFAVTGFFTVLTNQFINALWVTGVICYVLAGFVQPVLFLQRTGKLSCLCAS